MELLTDFPPGPLDFYRKKSTFDWKKLKIFLETEDIIRFQNEILEEYKKHPELRPTNNILTLDQERLLAFKQYKFLSNNEKFEFTHHVDNLKKFRELIILEHTNFPSGSVKKSVTYGLPVSTIQSLGTGRHSTFIEELENKKAVGCFCLTEIGHGSNTKQMQTRATYDRNTKEWVLLSPTFEAAKCWAGGLGQTATHAIVFAQLYLNNVNHGLHTFVVPIRDPKTHLPYPGVILADMGAKLGLNGVDNGVLLFKNYRIPRKNLLNKNADVTEDGKYTTPFKDPRKRHGASFGVLSNGRVAISSLAEGYALKALTIAVRYVGVRRQFGSNDQEVPVLEYQSTQYRILPYLAAFCTIKIFSTDFTEKYFQFLINTYVNTSDDTLADQGLEIHALSSATKPTITWLARECIQECREVCGGHGYLAAAGIGQLRNSVDPTQTYEGENHVLIQQTANWLLKLWPKILRDEKIQSPMGSINFLTNAKTILNEKFILKCSNDICQPENIINIYRWLACFLLKESWEKINRLKDMNEDDFWAKNNSQVFYLKHLSIIFIEQHILQTAFGISKNAPDANIKNVLNRSIALYGLFKLEKYNSILYRGAYSNGPELGYLIEEGILKLCAELKNDAVSLVDAIGPSDYTINSVLGGSDGLVYKRLEKEFFDSPYFMARPEWWKDITQNNQLNSKLMTVSADSSYGLTANRAYRTTQQKNSTVLFLSANNKKTLGINIGMG